MIQTDYVVIGAGIAGASVAFELATHGRTILLEAEAHAGYHATGRSAAMLMRAYGDDVSRALTRISVPFLSEPPESFGDAKLLTQRGGLWLRRNENEPQLGIDECSDQHGCLIAVDCREVQELVPVLRPQFTTGALFEPDACEIDVHQLLTGYVKGLRNRRGQLIHRQEALLLTRKAGRWIVETQTDCYDASIVVNAAGAWGDEVARRAGIRPLGLLPKRRTAFTFPLPDGLDAKRWPFTVDMREPFYFTPDAGLLLASPADETLAPPADVQAEEFDVALGVHRIENATTLEVRSIHSKWAGLRTFTPDGNPAVGMDRTNEGFFWLVGQGGAGVMTAPALARYCADLITGVAPPDEFKQNGIDMNRLSPTRFQQPFRAAGSETA